MNATRRDVFKFTGGSALGLLFTPAPWRLITDTALWSENWPGIPRPGRGENRIRYTHCGLCPAGCGVRARCVGDQPVALAGAADGALCALGVAGHHLPYHPARLKEAGVGEAAAAVAEALWKCRRDQSVAVLDLRPGRTASWTYRRALAALPNGLYLTPRSTLPAANLERAKTILSLGVPVLDGWGTAARVFAARDRFRLIQADPLESRTATLANVWLPIRPGTESTLAWGLANLALHANPTALPARVAEQAARHPPAEVAATTGLTEAQIRAAAEELMGNGPALVLAEEPFDSVVALNVLLGAWGNTLVERREAPVPEHWRKAAPVTEFAGVPDGSIRVLLIDESSPAEPVAWSHIQKKLAAEALVITFAGSREGYGRHAQYTLPTAVYPETTDDVAPAADSVTAAFRLVVPLVPAAPGVVSPQEFVAALAELPAANALRERADVIHRSRRGTLCTYADGKSVPVTQVSADDFWKALNAGGYWIDSGSPRASAPKLRWDRFPASPEACEASAEWPLIAVTCERRAAGGLIPPLMSKVYRESNLRPTPGFATLDPATARQLKMVDGGRGALETRYGTAEVQVGVDSGVPPGVVQIAATPELWDLCGRVTPARMVRI